VALAAGGGDGVRVTARHVEIGLIFAICGAAFLTAFSPWLLVILLATGVVSPDVLR
jgi:hypothetical protein